MAAGEEDGAALLGRLGARQLELAPDPYLVSHLSSEPSIQREVEAFELYADRLPEGRILDWGCRHAPSSCLIRNRFGRTVELHGCDRVEPAFEPFHEFAGLSYRQLEDPVILPYSDAHFDAVISNGVLEHVADPPGSLRELGRVLRGGGLLVVTFLPNRWSVSEAVSRRLGRPHHSRLYRLTDAKALLGAAGFDLVASGYHQVVPTLSSSTLARRSGPRQLMASSLYRANPAFERSPLKRLASNLFLLARKH